MGKTLALILCLLPLHVFAANCDTAGICKSTKGIDSVPDRISNGVTIRGGRMPKLGECSETCELKDESRMRGMFEDAKARLRNFFLAGRPVERISASEKAVIDSIEKRKMTTTKDSLQCAFTCLGGGLAFYLPGKGVCICPVMESMPDEFMMYVLGHEVGHSADVCAEKMTGLKPGEHPFERVDAGGSVLQCLELNGIPGERADGENRRAKEPGIFGKMIGRKAEPKPDNIHCAEAPVSKMAEAGADVMGLEVMASFIKDHPFERDEPANMWRAFGMFINLGCGGTAINEERHPAILDRVGKIALSLPNVRAGLSCRGHTQNLDCSYRPEGTSAPPTDVSSPANTHR